MFAAQLGNGVLLKALIGQLGSTVGDTRQ